jgi:sRNA-binding carbon storage regulator CsrA
MIKITRNIGQAIVIGGTRVVVLDVQGKRVVLAIEPEPGVNVARQDASEPMPPRLAFPR